MHALNNSGTLELMDKLPLLISFCVCIDKLGLTCTRNLHLNSLIHIAVGMSGNRYRLLPVLDKRFNALNYNRSAENRSVKY